MKARFGRYVFLKKLAVGGMAEIYLARRLSFGGFAKSVVIKRLLPEHRGRSAYERLFLNEARIAALLNHPNIVSLHDLGKLDDAFFMAMEYVHGVSGAELMSRAVTARKPIPLGVALRVVIGTAQALHYCTATPDLDSTPFGVLHHDISPHNVQLSYEGDVKLLDFGVATRMGRPAAGGRRGKFAYMSPEAIRKQPLDQRSDLFSLGVVLYELTLGRRLFKGATPRETEERATAGVIKPPTQVDSYYPPSLEEVVLRALARNPEQRFSNGQEMASALFAVTRKLGVDTSADAMTRYLHDLYGEEIDARRDELHRLALASAPRRTGESAAVPSIGTPEPALEGEVEGQPAGATTSETPRKLGPAAGTSRDPSPPDATAAQGRAADLDAADLDPGSAAPGTPAPTKQSLLHPPELAAQSASDMDVLDDAEPERRTPSLIPMESTSGEGTAEGSLDPEMAPEPDEPSEVSVAPTESAESNDPEPPPAERAIASTAESPPNRGSDELPPEARDTDADWDSPAAPGGPAKTPARRGMLWGIAGALLAAAAIGAGLKLTSAGRGDTAALRFESDPPGARVYDGEKLLGMTPFTSAPIHAGTTLNLRMVRDGHQTWTNQVTVPAGGAPQHFWITLRPEG